MCHSVSSQPPPTTTFSLFPPASNLANGRAVKIAVWNPSRSVCILWGEGYLLPPPPRPWVPFSSSQQQITCNYLTLKAFRSCSQNCFN